MAHRMNVGAVAVEIDGPVGQPTDRFEGISHLGLHDFCGLGDREMAATMRDIGALGFDWSLICS
jgi:hypothetical protein